jgi:malate dehydrogenase (oxaloacetate-decarboxylating)(NADP+)
VARQRLGQHFLIKGSVLERIASAVCSDPQPLVVEIGPGRGALTAAGKMAVVPTKPCRTQRDLSLAYTPGVAVPCLEIERDPSLAYKYTAKGNLVASSATAPRCWDWAISAPWPASPSWKARACCSNASPISTCSTSSSPPRTRRDHPHLPDCSSPPSAASTWKTSRRRSASTSRKNAAKTMKIPVFHDDQHGTAIISGAGLLNALELSARRSTKSRWSSTAPAPAPFPARPLHQPGRAPREHRHVRHQGRDLRRPHRRHESLQGALRLQTEARTLAEALVGADVFFGLSSGNCVTPKW